jgi:hypothetical protein
VLSAGTDLRGSPGLASRGTCMVRALIVYYTSRIIAQANSEVTMVPAPVRRARLMETYVQPAAIVGTWLGLVALGTVCFFAPRGGEAQPAMNDVVGFGCSMAIAGAAAAVGAFAIGGRTRWASQLALSALLLGAVVALLLLYFLWYDPMIVRQRLDRWTFEALQSDAAHWAEQVAGYHGPLGATVGLALGAVAGLLIKFGRRRPRLATGAALAIMILFASDFGRQSAVDVVTWLGWRLRYLFVPGSISSDQISITAIIFGAVVGATIADLTMYATRSTQMQGPGFPRSAECLARLAAGPPPVGVKPEHTDAKQSDR